MTKGNLKLDNVNVISRTEIPAITSIIHQGVSHNLGELRDFHKHELLNAFVPQKARLSMSWTRLKGGESLKNHKHPESSMIVVCEGQGKITGEIEKDLKAGDVIVIPPNCVHGFKGINKGMNCLSIQFDDMGGLYENIDNPLVEFIDKKNNEYNLDELLKFNEQRMQSLFKNRFFEMIQDGTLEDANKRKIFLDALQVWTDKNQLLLMSRQAMCVDDNYSRQFLQHFKEEVNHDLLFKDRDDPDEKYDEIIDAIACWFILQMYQLDNVEKAAIIHLVIENASDYYHKLARPLLNKFVNDEYFKVHEADTEHAQWGIDLLQGYNERVYLRLKEIIEQAWDMLEAMTNRVVELTEGKSDDKVS